MYLCSTQTPAAETGHASWQTGTPEIISTTFGDRKVAANVMDIVWIWDNPWHAIASSFIYNDRLYAGF
jgi:hypothetical protein